MLSSIAGKMPMVVVLADQSILANLALRKMDFFAIHYAKMDLREMVPYAGRLALQVVSQILELIA